MFIIIVIFITRDILALLYNKMHKYRKPTCC